MFEHTLLCTHGSSLGKEVCVLCVRVCNVSVYVLCVCVCAVWCLCVCFVVCACVCVCVLHITGEGAANAEMSLTLCSSWSSLPFDFLASLTPLLY